MARKLTLNQNLALIRLIHEHRVIWATNDANYQSNSAKSRAWAQIYQQMKTSTDTGVTPGVAGITLTGKSHYVVSFYAIPLEQLIYLKRDGKSLLACLGLHSNSLDNYLNS